MQFENRLVGTNPAEAGSHSSVGAELARPEATTTEEHGASELGLMGLATIVALAGIGVAAFFFLKRRDAATALAQRFAGLHRLLLRKYYVDEAYEAAVVNPIVTGSEKGLWKGIDVGVIDGAVNGVGRLVRGTSGVLRLAQTGSIRAYAASLFLGAALVLAYLILR